ncbi:hypothetical protein [Legionella impletisoli]|uniref:Uncharacterized protein n=1 Tax=Legionella impletisoli TaxID=343510 RepID=A0A917JMZ8_9GAMM|nr:hypothetical protein [Legionella impletisoli]GGI78111.1 hypothetical protein GCM10007966_03520 [Legionella impletisoli]
MFEKPESSFDPTLVEMDECVFKLIKNDNDSLMTIGVTTCICLMFYGHLNTQPFIGMYHWSGFDRTFEDDEEDKGFFLDEVSKLIYTVYSEARRQLQSSPSQKLHLNRLFIVGGERRQHNTQGELLVTGTELEVQALKQYAIEQCNLYFCTPEKIEFQSINYLKTGDQFLNIIMTENHPTWEVVEQENGEQSELAESDDLTPRNCFSL